MATYHIMWNPSWTRWKFNWWQKYYLLYRKVHCRFVHSPRLYVPVLLHWAAVVYLSGSHTDHLSLHASLRLHRQSPALSSYTHTHKTKSGLLAYSWSLHISLTLHFSDTKMSTPQAFNFTLFLPICSACYPWASSQVTHKHYQSGRGESLHTLPSHTRKVKHCINLPPAALAMSQGSGTRSLRVKY